MAAVALNVVSFVVAGLLTFWLLTNLQLSGYQALTRVAWHRRGVFRRSSLVGTLAQSIVPALVALVPPALVVGGLALFAPASLAWSLHRWGAWTGVGIAAALALLSWIGISRAERMADFYGDHREAIAPKLGVRQMSCVKPFRDAWDAAEKAKHQAAQVPAGEADTDPQPHLDFQIVSVAQGQQVTDTPPYTTGGGDWTVMTCRTHATPAASFFLAERSGEPTGGAPFAWGEAKLWVTTAADGARLAEAIGDAFLVEGRERAPAGTAPAAPLAFGTVVLSRNTQAQPDGSLSGKGSWTASKWFYEEATEFFVNWSVAEKKGRFAEKDEDYRSDLYAAFRALVA